MKFLSNSKTAMVSACAAALVLSACGNKGDAPAAGDPAAASDAGTELTQEVSEKFSHYVTGFNELISTFGIGYQYDRYQMMNLASAQPTATLNFPSQGSVLERALTSLKAGRAINTGNQTPAADAAADKLIQNLEGLLAQYKELGPYYETRAYREDALAKGKAADAQISALYEATLKSTDELDEALTEQERALSTQRIQALRKAGEDNAANLLQATSRAELLVSKSGEGDFAAGDALLTLLEADLAKLRESAAKMDDNDINKSWYTSIISGLTSLIGQYRDTKQNPNDDTQDTLIDNYNQVINDLNRVELPI